jgi:uncharacterized Zn-finger protein
MSKEIQLKITDLNTLGGVHCPNPTMLIWNSHPKIAIDIVKHGQGRCHYCGTVYKLAAGEIAANGNGH